MRDMCVYFVLNIQRLWLIYPIRIVYRNNIYTALHYNTCYSHTKSPTPWFYFWNPPGHLQGINFIGSNSQIQQFCAIAQWRKFYIKQLLLLVTILILYRKLYFFYTAIIYIFTFYKVSIPPSGRKQMHLIIYIFYAYTKLTND